MYKFENSSSAFQSGQITELMSSSVKLFQERTQQPSTINLPVTVLRCGAVPVTGIQKYEKLSVLTLSKCGGSRHT